MDFSSSILHTHSIIRTSTTSANMEIQTIEERYVDMKKLAKLLKELFGKAKCEIEVSIRHPQSKQIALFTDSLKIQDEYVLLTILKRLSDVKPIT